MANLYDKASLVLPTSPAYKDGAIQAYKPLTSQGTFDFTRGSNLAATRVDANGFIEKGRENALLQSNNFNTTWSKNATTSIVGGQSGYDGTNNAWLWTAANATFSNIQQTNLIGSGVVTLSIYAKAGNTNFIALQPYGSGSAFMKFNLSNGTIHETTGTPIDGGIESLGNGWYRCYVVDNYNTSYVNVYLLDSAGNFNNSATDSIYIQDAQLEAGLVATDYIETGASTAQAGILEDMPRLDYSGGASCPALLLEPQRTNVIASSEYLSDWGSTIVGTGVTPILNANAAISPEGVQNAYEVTFNSGAGTTSSDISMINYNIGGQGTGDYVLSFYAKVSNGTDKIIVRHAGGFQYTTINLTDKWQRFFVKENLAVAGTITVDIGLRRGLINEPLNSSVTCQIYGLQLEAGSYPTSYIPTYGSSVTRGADSCSKTGISGLIGQTEGTLFIELEVRRSGRFALLGSTGNFMEILLNSSGQVNAFVYNGATQVDFDSPSIYNTGDVLKMAFAYKANDFVMYVNGVQEGTDTSGAVPSSMSAMRLNSYLVSGYEHAQNFKQALLFKTRLTNAELASLTTL